MKAAEFLLLRAVGAVIAAFVFSACSKDPTTEPTSRSSFLCFEVATAEGWNALPQSRADADVAPTLEFAGVFALQGETPADSLFLHAAVTNGIEGSCIGSVDSQTRATPVGTATFYDSFGVLASVYTGSWSESSCLPDYMYNIEVTKASSWTTSYLWPGAGRNIRIFAYAPYNGQGIVLSDKTKVGTPSIAYTVSSDVADQQDLLVATSAEMAGNAASAALLTFNHALTAVRFTTGDDMLSGSISKITLKGVYDSATHAMGSASWSNYGSTADFSQTLSAAVDGSADQQITPAAATFMMLPQTLPSDASIEVVYTDALTGIQRTLTASIAGSQWPMGKTVTYRISTSSISVTPTFTVTAPADFTYAGGSKTYSVTSYASVSRPGDATKTVAVAWTAEFVEDDGAGGYTVISRPDWLTAFTASGNGSTSASSFPATVAAQQSITANWHNNVLQAAAPVSGTYDLATKGGTATMNTANCYVINAPGTYSLPLVYGNAIKNGTVNSSAYTSAASGSYVLRKFVNHLGAAITDPYIYNNANCTPKDAVLVWQDEQNLVTNVALSSDNHSLTFDVSQASIKQGNAIVAVRDASNRIMWSWHIWVTDYVPGLAATIETQYDPTAQARDKVVTNYQGVQYTFAGVPLGWCDGETTTNAARSVKVRFTQKETRATQIITLTQAASHMIVTTGSQLYFQFGRKDPMLPAGRNASGSIVDKDCYSNSGYTFNKSGKGKVTIATSIQNPHVFYNYGSSSPYNWCSTSYHNLWSADNTGTTMNDNTVVKTIYDPSPAGYCLPASNAFTGFSYDGNNTKVDGNSFGSTVNSPYTSTADFTSNLGWVFYCNKMHGAGSYDTSGGIICFQASGYRTYGTGEVYAVNNNGYNWSAVPKSEGEAFHLFFYVSAVNPLHSSGRSYGFAVRPVRE